MGINFDEGAQDTFGNHFSAHRAVQEKIEIFRGPFRDLSRIDFIFRRLIGRRRDCDRSRRDHED